MQCHSEKSFSFAYEESREFLLALLLLYLKKILPKNHVYTPCPENFGTPLSRGDLH